MPEERGLHRVEGYEPQFVHYPLEFVDFEINLTPEDEDCIHQLLAMGLVADTEEAIRLGVFGWYAEHRTSSNPLSMFG